MALERDFLTEDKIYCDAGDGCGRCLSEVDPDTAAKPVDLESAVLLDAEREAESLRLERERNQNLSKKILSPPPRGVQGPDATVYGCPPPAEVSKLKLCKIERAGNYCIGETGDGSFLPDTEKCGTRVLENCPDKNNKMRHVYFSVTSDKALKQASIDADAMGILSMVSKARREEIYKSCRWAMYDDHYCMFLKHEGNYETMTCTMPTGGVRRPRPKYECTSDLKCNGVKSPLHNKCVDNYCRMQYKRIVQVGLVTTDSDETDHCSEMGPGWETVKVSTDGWDDPEDLNQIRGGTSTGQSRLCVKYSTEPVTENPDTHGVCRVLIQKDEACGNMGSDAEGNLEKGSNLGGGHEWRSVELGGAASGDIGQYDHDPALFICVAYDGCEGRGQDDVLKPARALSKLEFIRDGHGGGLCPKDMKNGHRIWTANAASGDFNQGMGSGGDVYLCETREEALFAGF